MAKISIRFIYVVRHLCWEVEQLLNTSSLGIPMNFELDPEKGEARIFWAGGLCVKGLVTSDSDSAYGDSHEFTQLVVSNRFLFADWAKEWIQKLEVFTGPLNATLTKKENGTYVRFNLKGKELMRLKTNASNRRNGLPESKWQETC